MALDPVTLADVIGELKTASLPPVAALAAGVPLADELAPAVFDRVDTLYRGVYLMPDDWRLLRYGVYVLAAARHGGLWPRLVLLARLPEEDLDELFLGRADTALAQLMLSVWDGDADALFRLIEHADMVGLAKGALFDVLARVTFDGRIPRERTVAFLERFEREGLADVGDQAWWGWGDAVLRLGIAPLEPALQRVWAQHDNSGVELDTASALDLLQRSAANPADASAFEEAGVVEVTDPAIALKWVEEDAERLVQMMREAGIDLTAQLALDDLLDDPGADVGLSADEEQWLAGFLLSRQAPDSTMSLEMLDGFFTGFVIGPPGALSAEALLAELWGTEGGVGPEWDTPEQQAYVKGLLVKHMAAIQARRDADALHYPVIGPGSDVERGAEWADGFMTAIDMAAEAWEPLYKDRRGYDVVSSIYALCGDDPEVFEEKITPKIRAASLEALPQTLQLIAAFWREPGGRMPRREPIRTAKIGRNDPCPCGSGKKFKKCCAVTTPPDIH